MSRKRLSMKKLKEVYRMKFELRCSHRSIAASLGISASTVSEYLDLFKSSGAVFEEIKALPTEQLEAIIYRHPKNPARVRPPADYQKVYQELKKKGVTLSLLWVEYKEDEPNGLGYTQFCRKYQEYVKTLNPVMRFNHKAGEKCSVDYSGLKMEWLDVKTGEIHNAEIFVGCLNASNLIFCEATQTQSLPDWIASHMRMFEFFGGVPETLIVDNLKSGVTKAHRYDPDLNPTYTLMAEHYQVAIIPARVRAPKDKPHAEVSVQCVEREIIAVLRHMTFTSLEEVNAAIKERLTLLNKRPMQKINLSRLQQFNEIEKDTLKPLPQYRFALAQWKSAKVHIDYHIDINKHFYSVPYRFIGKKVDVCVTKNTIDIFYLSQRIALHQRDDTKARFTTVEEHMPAQHQHYFQEQKDGSIDFFMNWAKQKEEVVHQYMKQFFASRIFPQQAIRACFGLKRLCERFGDERFIKACEKALKMHRYRYQTVEEILNHDLDKSKGNATHVYRDEDFRGKNYYQ